MRNSTLGRAIRAAALAFLTLAVPTGCGKDGGSDITDPPSDPGPPDPSPSGWDGPAPVGDVIYAVDLGNNFLVFGTGSLGTLTAKMQITGLPILKRIIGIAFRPADGKLYGVGNDSRLYRIDPLTAVATPVSTTQFSPKIADFFDIHFAMAREPNGERVRLIAAESGANWSISLADGTATSGENAQYGGGTELEGQTPHLLGLFYAPPVDSAVGVCGNLAYAVDADEAIVIASCDPATGAWWPTGKSPQASLISQAAGRHAQPASASASRALEELKDQLLRCGEVMPSPGDVNGPAEEPPPDGGPWFPRSPDTPFYVFVVEVGTLQQSMGEVMPIDPTTAGLTLNGNVDPAAQKPIQTATWAEDLGMVSHSQHRLRPEMKLSAATSAELESGTAATSQSDPRAQCR